jgi:hypothetical protein
MNIPDKVAHAVFQLWNIAFDLEERLNVEELGDDWIVWRKEDAEKSGGLRLVVPKRGAQAFEISSSAVADDQHGVSYDYEIYVLDTEHASKEAAIIIERHTGISRREAYQGLKTGFPLTRTFFIATPLDLIRELRDLNVRVDLVRPGSRGEYRTS